MKSFNLKDIDFIFLDFDGVLTNNKVFVDENGIESVSCNRSDGLAAEVLNKLGLKTIIFSSEKNKVVKRRAKKLNLDCYNSIKSKKSAILSFAKSNSVNLSNCMYVGNDLNDYHAMKICGLKICPADAHKKIINISDYVTKKNGGDGVLREIVEKFLKIDIVSFLS